MNDDGTMSSLIASKEMKREANDAPLCAIDLPLSVVVAVMDMDWTSVEILTFFFIKRKEREVGKKSKNGITVLW